MTSSSQETRNVGSSLVNLWIALAKLSPSFLLFGLIDNEITESGTKIDSMLRFDEVLSTTNVSPEAQSIPNRAQMSPALAYNETQRKKN